MLLTRTSILTGATREREIDVTRQQLDEYNRGVLPEEAFEHISCADREFIVSGITPDEWSFHVSQSNTYDDTEVNDLEEVEYLFGWNRQEAY